MRPAMFISIGTNFDDWISYVRRRTLKTSENKIGVQLDTVQIFYFSDLNMLLWFKVVKELK